MMNQKNVIMAISGVVACVTSLVFAGSAMNLIGVRKTPNATLDPAVAGQQPTPPAKKAAKKNTTENETTVENI